MLKTRKLFGSSGLRGELNKEITPELAATVGVAIAEYSNYGKVIVARDTRISGNMLEDALVAGILSGGAKPHLAGVLPTPVLAYCTRCMSMDAGVMITASHNPPQYNGIKIFDPSGISLGDTEQEKMQQRIEAKLPLTSWNRICSTRHVFAEPYYQELILNKTKLKKNWRVIVDSGCGATYRIAPIIFKSLGCKVTALNAQPDGFFPARSSEPNPDSLKPLAEIARANRADFAVGFDGDGDRMALIDEKGIFADFDRVLASYAGWVAGKKGGALIVTSVEASMCIDRMVEKAGGRVVRTRVGDVYITDEMKKLDSVFGGEPCGAWVHPSFNYCPDGILSAVMVMVALEERDTSLSEFISRVPHFETVRRNIECTNELKFKVVEDVEEKLKEIFPEYVDSTVVDGVRLGFREGWILVRASGTEPLIRLTVEGESLRTANLIMRKGRDAVLALIRKFSI